ncbi:stage II sporulation protein R [Paenibacillus xerothermodurans]|uniref:Stage II sporulation protein R n=1 Tax=Paenibacillus xerothermodurans TaxID=1977292 RepID=A0A2W1N6I5_PAEXE|nr:stage II sporulation protein R [Paenibacillus xerothermodurans]PZE19414.1 stage II sporulation protein R [Paenibacillus xerothermodurans]
MVVRTAWSRYFYIAFALILLISCWELNVGKSIAKAAGSRETADAANFIPEESIRLRILANSDSPADQWIKREVRDAIVARMGEWVEEPQGIEAARAAVRSHLPDIRELVGQTLSENGFDYAYDVELGMVPFPTKMYGNQVYPAGQYEALRVTIGTAKGQNWWCVLFPPLCFVDSEAIAKPATARNAGSVGKEDAVINEAVTDRDAERVDAAAGAYHSADEPAQSQGSSVGEAERQLGGPSQRQLENAETATGRQYDTASDKNVSPQPEIRFFLLDMFHRLGNANA